MKRFGIVLNVGGILLLLAGLLGKFTTTVEQDLKLMRMGVFLAFLGLGIMGAAIYKQKKRG